MVIGLSVLVVLGGLYLIAAAVNGLAPFSSATSSNGSSTATTAPGASGSLGPGTTVPTTTNSAPSLDNLMPDQGCNQPPANVTQGFAGLTSSLQCTNDPNLPSVVVEGFQFGNAADYTTGLQLLDKNLGFRPAAACSACPPTVSPSGATPWQTSDYPGQSGQNLQCLTASGDPTYVWTIPSRLVFLEAVDTNAQDGYADLQNWFVNDAEP